MTEQNGVERSSTIDELRAMAESVGLAVPKAATLMMQAADQLDFALDSKRIAERYVTKLLEENAKLRKLAHKMWKPFCWAQSGYDVCLSDKEDREIRDLAHKLGVEVPE